MHDKYDALKTTFPWLTDAEAIDVARRVVALAPAKSVGDALREIADLLDSLGLPPTSNLLLALVGRGSKSTALAISRATARARFERASRDSAEEQLVERRVDKVRETVEPPPPATVPAPGAQPGAELLEAVRQIMSKLGDAKQPTIDKEVLEELKAMRGELSWLKSTIDTERQLRRYHEKHGSLSEPAAAAQSPAARMQKVSSLSSSLERDRYKPHDYDEADGPGE